MQYLFFVTSLFAFLLPYELVHAATMAEGNSTVLHLRKSLTNSTPLQKEDLLFSDLWNCRTVSGVPGITRKKPLSLWFKLLQDQVNPIEPKSEAYIEVQNFGKQKFNFAHFTEKYFHLSLKRPFNSRTETRRKPSRNPQASHYEQVILRKSPSGRIIGEIVGSDNREYANFDPSVTMAGKRSLGYLFCNQDSVITIDKMKELLARKPTPSGLDNFNLWWRCYQRSAKNNDNTVESVHFEIKKILYRLKTSTTGNTHFAQTEIRNNRLIATAAPEKKKSDFTEILRPTHLVLQSAKNGDLVGELLLDKLAGYPESTTLKGHSTKAYLYCPRSASYRDIEPLSVPKIPTVEVQLKGKERTHLKEFLH